MSEPSPTSKATPEISEERKLIKKGDVIQEILNSYEDGAEKIKQDRCKRLISKFLNQEVSQHTGEGILLFRRRAVCYDLI